MSVCRECGLAANTLTCLAKYGKRPKKDSFAVSTFNLGECGCCGRTTHVTEERDYFYPDFSLVSENFKKRLREGGK